MRSSISVVSYGGKTVPKSKTKKIKNSYYIVGDPKIKNSGECYKVEGKYHRFNNGYIEYDYEKGEYVLIHKNTLREGIVDFDEEKQEFVIGTFSPNTSKNISLVPDEASGKKNLCISEEVAKKGKFRERLLTGFFYNRTIKNANWFSKIGKAPISKSSLVYESRFASSLTEIEYNKNFKPKEESKQLNILGDFLEKHGMTFGVEFETTLGYIPERLCYKYGLIPLRDGSIAGLEYVTIPLGGRKGLYALKEICAEMNKRTKYDHSCALHIHIAGLSRTENSVLSAFILSVLVQDEQFLLQPAYKKGGSRTQNKDYCKPLPTSSIFSKLPSKITADKITVWFNKVFKFISDGSDYSKYKNNLSNVETHPSDPAGDRKWQIHSRYFWINFVPLLFGNKKTLEFRHHNITNDFNKIVCFLVNCATFIWTAENCKDQLFDDSSELFSKLIKKPHDSNNILLQNLVKSENCNLLKISEHVDIYNSIRKNIMRDLNEKGDIIAKTEKSSDKNYYVKGALSKTFWN